VGPRLPSEFFGSTLYVWLGRTLFQVVP